MVEKGRYSGHSNAADNRREHAERASPKLEFLTCPEKLGDLSQQVMKLIRQKINLHLNSEFPGNKVIRKKSNLDSNRRIEVHEKVNGVLNRTFSQDSRSKMGIMGKLITTHIKLSNISTQQNHFGN